jgi:hypothetical protein
VVQVVHYRRFHRWLPVDQDHLSDLGYLRNQLVRYLPRDLDFLQARPDLAVQHHLLDLQLRLDLQVQMVQHFLVDQVVQ